MSKFHSTISLLGRLRTLAGFVPTALAIVVLALSATGCVTWSVRQVEEMQSIAVGGDEIVVVQTSVVGGVSTTYYVEAVESFNPWSAKVLLTRHKCGSDGETWEVAGPIEEVSIDDKDLEAGILSSKGNPTRYQTVDLMAYLFKKGLVPGAWSLHAGGGDGVVLGPDMLENRESPMGRHGELVSHVMAYAGEKSGRVLYGNVRTGECGVGSRSEGVVYRASGGFNYNCVWDWKNEQVVFVQWKHDDDEHRMITIWKYGVGRVQEFELYVGN